MLKFACDIKSRLIEFRLVAVCQVVESSSALILQLKTEDLKAAWQYYMALATYKAPVCPKNVHIEFIVPLCCMKKSI